MYICIYIYIYIYTYTYIHTHKQQSGSLPQELDILEWYKARRSEGFCKRVPESLITDIRRANGRKRFSTNTYRNIVLFLQTYTKVFGEQLLTQISARSQVLTRFTMESMEVEVERAEEWTITCYYDIYIIVYRMLHYLLYTYIHICLCVYVCINICINT